MTKIEFQEEMLAHKGAVYALCEGPSPNSFFSAGSDCNVLLWDLNDTQKPKLIAKSPSIVISLKFLAEQNLLLIGQAEGGIHVIALEDKKEIHYLKAQTNYLFAMQYLPEKEELISTAGDGSMAVWSTKTFKNLLHKPLCQAKVRALANSPERNELAIGLGTGSVHLYDASDYSVKHKIESFRSSINCLMYWNKKELFCGEKDAYLTTIDTDSWARIQEIPAHNWAIYAMLKIPEQNRFITASRDKTIKLWDASKMSVLQRIEGHKIKAHTHSVNCLLWNDTHQTLISSGDDGKIKRWKLQ